VLGLAGAGGADLGVSLRSLSESRTVPAALGARVESDGELGATEPDVVVVPGGGWNDRAAQGAWAEAESGELPERLVALHEDGATLASVCTGGMILARAGLLDGRPSTTNHDALDELRETDAEVIEARVVDDGDIVTAGAITAGLDLGLHLLEREFGETVATVVAEGMAYERRGPIHVA
jgi:transcriptional regulator GlxA family with amidase domain